jgi:hypothetical protein
VAVSAVRRVARTLLPAPVRAALDGMAAGQFPTLTIGTATTGPTTITITLSMTTITSAIASSPSELADGGPAITTMDMATVGVRGSITKRSAAEVAIGGTGITPAPITTNRSPWHLCCESG